MDDIYYNRNKEDASIQLVAERIGLLHEDMNELKDSMKESMREMASAVNKLVAVETRQEAMNQSYERVSKILERETLKREELESRVDALEREQPIQKQVTKWILTAIWGAVTLVGIFAAKTLGLL